MEEKNLIRKIEKLNAIKPREGWAFFAKKEIFKKKPLEKSPSLKDILFTPIKKPALAFAFRGVMVLVVVLAGAYLYMYHLNNSVQDMNLAQISQENQERDIISKSLGEIKESLVKVNSSLKELENSANFKEALVMTRVIKETTQRSKEEVERIKESSGSQSYASLGEIEDTLGEIEKESYNIEQEMIERVFEDLTNRELSEENQVRLEKAGEYHNEGKQNEAVILIMKIMETPQSER